MTTSRKSNKNTKLATSVVVADQVEVIEQPVIEVIDEVIEQPVIEDVVDNSDQLKFLGLIKEIDQQVVENKQTVVLTETTTKASLGRSIWNDEVSKQNGQAPIRATTIKRLMLEAGLTQAGAATYFQNMKKKAGFVNSKV